MKIFDKVKFHLGDSVGFVTKKMESWVRRLAI